jgi:hypothetical protein
MDNRAAEDNTLSLKKSGLPAVSHPGHGLVNLGRAGGDSGFKRIREGSRRGSDDIDHGQARQARRTKLGLVIEGLNG